MAEQRTGIYEIMILTSQGAAAYLSDFLEHLNLLFERCGANVVALQKWDERRLAYEIDKQRRGVYFLAYVEIDTRQVQQFERDTNISEKIMRVMITKADHLSREQMEAADGREELATEAKMRAERGDDREEGAAGTVRLGAPVKKEEPKDEAPAEPVEAESGSEEAPAPAES